MNADEFISSMNKAVSADNDDAIIKGLIERTETLIEEMVRPATVAEIPCIIAALIVAKSIYSEQGTIQDKILAKALADTVSNKYKRTVMPSEPFKNDSP